MNDYRDRLDARMLALFDEYRERGQSVHSARIATVAALGQPAAQTRERLDTLLGARRNGQLPDDFS